jgi:hypothetical protein
MGSASIYQAIFPLKEGLTQISVWPHAKKQKSGFSLDWSISNKEILMYF